MSVKGIDLFRDAMAGLEGSYVLIGGSACGLLFAEQGVDFRPTKDLDIVVVADGPGSSFAKAFWGFVRAGGYEPWCGKDEAIHYYRFLNPKVSGYPHMLSLTEELHGMDPCLSLRLRKLMTVA